MRKRIRRGGFTMVELVVSIVVIGIALCGVLLVMNHTTAHSADPMIQHQGVAIAEAYLEEILLRPYLDPDTNDVCPVPEGNRSNFDNVCDYDGLDDSGARDQITPGTAIPELADYRVRVTVQQAAALNDFSGSAQVLRADVRVTHGIGLDIFLSGYRTAY